MVDKGQAMTDEPRKFEIIDNPSIAESYANKLIAASFDGGAVVIAPAAAVELANALNKLLKMLVQIQQNAAAAAKPN
jgi:hypothetical protein